MFSCPILVFLKYLSIFENYCKSPGRLPVKVAVVLVTICIENKQVLIRTNFREKNASLREQTESLNMPTFLKTLFDLLAKKLGGDVLEGDTDENEIKELFVSTNSTEQFVPSPALSTPSCVSIDFSDSDIVLCRTPETYSLQYAQQGFLKKALKKEEATHMKWVEQIGRNKRTNDDISRRSSIVFGSQDCTVQ